MQTITETVKQTVRPGPKYRFVLYGDDSDRTLDPEAAWLYAIEAALAAFGIPYITVRAGEPIPPSSEPEQQTVVFHSRRGPAPEGRCHIGFRCYENAIRFIAQTVLNGAVPARPASSPIVFVTDPDLVFDPTANWVFAVRMLACMLGLDYRELDVFDPTELVDAIPPDAVVIAPYGGVLSETVERAAGGLITDFTAALRFVLAQAGIATAPSAEEEEEGTP